jgi:hypothetical protein
MDTFFFERIYVINLMRRPDRSEQFFQGLPPDWPFRKIEHTFAVDGVRVQPPPQWKQGGPAWGCYRSHLRIIEDCLNYDIKSVLIFEDDAIFPKEFTKDVTTFLSEVPEDWEMLYLGGQHLYENKHPPKQISPNVFQPYNVNRTHAYALNGRMLEIVYKHLLRRDWMDGHHIDHHYGRLLQRRENKIYCPPQWLVGQREGKSDIACNTKQTQFWKGAETLNVNTEDLPFVVVLGLHSSGSSCIAGILHHLGVHMGNTFSGFYGNDPTQIGSCGFEAVHLVSICNRAIPFPHTERSWTRIRIQHELGNWIKSKQREALHKGTIAGCKYPTLCQMQDALVSILGDNLKLIDCSRPLEKSITSLQRRPDRKHPLEALEAHQRWLWKGKQELLLQYPNHLKVDYDGLLQSPEVYLKKIIDYLGINPSSEQYQTALSHIQPSKCHVV